jgi:hypothetical protein
MQFVTMEQLGDYLKPLQARINNLTGRVTKLEKAAAGCKAKTVKVGKKKK